ncbi:MAG: alkaline phosphatase family protein [Acidobacteriaceae bacterium]|nr:alkaline phosphatase family protein [Acidobacteriaceae bacterium]MBV9781000.1 alkaline phosphatase family protein [Acidobacteriaceae bacterium]
MHKTFKACTVWALPVCLLFSGVVPLSRAEQSADTATPIKHLVVIFQENVSFDHYFATYPFAKNPSGEPKFWPRQVTNLPAVNGLNGGLLYHNPNSTQPFRLDRSQNYTCDQDHGYTAEQKAFDMGLMDKFPENTGAGGPGCPDYGKGTGLVMGYYDGNTVTALWNYAQYFALNDNSYGTNFGPSTVGALNLISGSTATVDFSHTTGNISGDVADKAVTDDPDPYYDDCGSPEQLAILGKNIGDLLNAADLTWGWFQGGFAPSSTSNGKAVCASKTPNLGGVLQTDYSAHHEPFEYYKQTANIHHLPPSCTSKIGYSDQANHQYDLTDFFKAVDSHNMPAVSFLKAKRSQDGHAGYSSPLDEQIFLVNTINHLEKTPEWNSTAVVILYDDSDGWYDHQMGPIVNQSATSQDALTGPNSCGTAADPLGGFQGRCGYGPRLPLLVISPWAKSNFVDSATTDQASVIRFVEDNWLKGERIGEGSTDAIAGSLMNMFQFNHELPTLILDPHTGEIAK